MSVVPHEITDEGLIIAPGEGRKTASFIRDKQCEELAFPHLFPNGKFGFHVDRDIKLTPTRYFNQRLLNYSQKFASDTNYIFFAHAASLKLNLLSKINTAMQKVNPGQLTAGMLCANFEDTVKSFIANDSAFRFMDTIKGAPEYWKRFMLEVLAMVKQLGLPTFFMTLSFADTRWNVLISIISKLQGVDISDDEINNLNFMERCKILNQSPVLLACQFQYRVEVFFQDIIGPLGKMKYNAIRVEFQLRGSPHIHSFIWIIDALILTKETKDIYIKFVENIIKVCIPDPETHPELFKFVRTYQVHKHHDSCRKYMHLGITSRYYFSKYFTDRTVLAEPLSKNMSEGEKLKILQKRSEILGKVKNYIDTNLDPSKVNILYPERPNFIPCKSITEILGDLGLSEQEYYNALSILLDNDYQILFFFK